MKRVFLIVLDSFGIGELPDADCFGDIGSNTLKSISSSEKFKADTLKALGLFNIYGVTVGEKAASPRAVYGRLSEKSNGKDTVTGHWEMMGLVSDTPMPTYPDGFPKDVIAEFEKRVGRKVICNKAYSGTQVINDYGKEHLETGALIVYTSADSVFQIAAHTDIVPLETLYSYCEIARGMLDIGRVIARPFTTKDGEFVRLADRRDYSLKPHGKTMLDDLKEQGFDVLAVGKISDIFAGEGITQSFRTHSNADGMQKALDLVSTDFNGLCFVNLVDFDSKYGHRNDVDGYANAIAEFDALLPGLVNALGEDDALIITADHGCDPATPSTDHSREYVPYILYGENITPRNIGTKHGFDYVGNTVMDLLGAVSDAKLCETAVKAMEKSYSPYSRFRVGAALLTSDGRVYDGCNIENASYSATVCAERTAFFKAVGDGNRKFLKIAIAGGKDGVITSPAAPCGVCRQVMSEWCDKDFEILLVTENGFERHTLGELLPLAFSGDSL